MNRYKYIIYTIIIILFLLIYHGVTSLSSLEEKNILFISLYDTNAASFDNKISGILDGIGRKFNLKTESMYPNTMNNDYNEKYFYNKIEDQEERLDAIILDSDKALEFAIKHRDSLFKDTPIVFFGVEDKELIKNALTYDLVSGIRQAKSLDSNIELITNIHKNTENIYIISDYKEDSFNKSVLYDEKKHIDSGVNINYIETSNISVTEFKEKLETLDENDAIIRLNSYRFKDHLLDCMKVSDFIKTYNNKVPVYSVSEYGIGYGDIGGIVVSDYNQAKEAGKIVKSTLLGKNLNNVYIDTEGINQYIFDYKRMKDFNIKKSQLPKGTILKHDLTTVFDKYSFLILSIIIFFIGLIAAIIALIICIHNKKKYEKILIKAINESNEANRLKSYFMSNITHELRTPITVIMSVMQLTKSKYKNNGYVLDENNVQLVDINCNRLLRLINNIIDAEKYESSELNLELENVNIVLLIEDIVESIVPFVKAKNLDIIFDTTDEEIIMAIDINKIERIILNLISNAIKFSKDRGTVYVNLEKDDNTLKISIKDEGIGISKIDLEKIYDRFVQLDTTTTRKNEGSGIGLTIVESFVKSHNGKISVESKINEGTTFTVEIPITALSEEIEYERYNNKEIDRKSKLELSDIYLN
ncbi:sensor histidine kinase [[Clostridium] dakarense]|uniref:sensor histidine kinase n=1 Tax=Faecalimicrobium dakarense TaxID=1301100 RepID=UPI0004AEE15C|nr:sensor histidine kinase [[Clostridium] dakarense]